MPWRCLSSLQPSAKQWKDSTSEWEQSGEHVSFNGVPNDGPKWRHTFNVSYQLGPFDLFAQWRYVGRGIYEVTAQSAIQRVKNYISDNRISAVSYFDLSLTYQPIDTADRKIEMFLRADNIFDKVPPIVIQGGINPISNSGSFYDLVGRRVTVGARFKL
jgi:iron complex outermembrane recepter protein